MLCRIKEYAAVHNMFEPGDKVILGLSGGADSVCLFFVLLELKKIYNLTLVAVHVHHGIRGQEADEDVEFVRDLCRNYNVKLHVACEDVTRRKVKKHKYIYDF